MENKPKQEESPFIKLMITLSFCMLVFITLAQDPVQKFVDNLSTDYYNEGMVKVCTDLEEREKVIEAEILDYFVQACIVGYKTANFQLFSDLLKMTDKETKKFYEDIQKEFKEGTERNEKVSEFCKNRLKESTIRLIAKGIYIDTKQKFDCYGRSSE